MSIETSIAAPGTKAVSGTAGHGGKGKAASGNETDALAAGGFLSLLMSFEPEVAVDAGVAGAAPPVDATNAELLAQGTPQLPAFDLNLLLGQVASAAVGQSAPGNALPVADLATAKQPALGVPVGNAAVGQSASGDALPVVDLATAKQPALLGVPVGNAAVGQSAAGNALPVADLATANQPALLGVPVGNVVVDQIVQGDAPPLAILATGDQPVAAVHGRGRLDASAIREDKPETAGSPSSTLAVETLSDRMRNVEALNEQMAQSLQARALKTRVADLRSGAAAILAESRSGNQSFAADLAAREPAVSGALLANGMGDVLLRPSDRPATKSSFSVTGSGLEGSWGQQAFQPGSRVDAPPARVDTSTLSQESMVADTVSYWVTQGIQNAELKLDGFGGESVEVSISLNGSEAHIDFRTDQPEVRQLLEGATAQLKDILKGEGLMLSGVSVGTSGQDGAGGGQERRNRPGAHQVTIAATQAGLPESPPRVNQSQSIGRALDIFV